MTRYLTTDELIYINEKLPNSDRIHRILKGRQRVRDMDMLEAAAGRPMTSAFGEDAYPTLQEKAAALLHSIARNHPFADGNKRTATIAALFMLEVNGLHVHWEPQQALEMIIAVAEGKRPMQDFAAWLPVMPGAPTLEEDAEADMRLIERLLSEHRWLLAELDKR